MKNGCYTNMRFFLHETVHHHAEVFVSDTHLTDITSQWQDDWKSASMANYSLVDDLEIWQPIFDLPRHHWSLTNCIRISQNYCTSCHKKCGLM